MRSSMSLLPVQLIVFNESQIGAEGGADCRCLDVLHRLAPSQRFQLTPMRKPRPSARPTVARG
ncbi:MAG: hypothetical protein E6575_19095, partial [Bradyrhizobium sp.]|nr:hypothetical protein [Bradyrhizobium sp.]